MNVKQASTQTDSIENWPLQNANCRLTILGRHLFFPAFPILNLQFHFSIYNLPSGSLNCKPNSRTRLLRIKSCAKWQELENLLDGCGATGQTVTMAGKLSDYTNPALLDPREQRVFRRAQVGCQGRRRTTRSPRKLPVTASSLDLGAPSCAAALSGSRYRRGTSLPV